MARLELPSDAVRESYLAGERELALQTGAVTGWLDAAARDFSGFARERAVVRERWGVPFTELWFVDGVAYIGSVNLRHRLTPALRLIGGNIGYHVVPSHRRHGHATEMLAQALAYGRETLGLTDILVTCAEDNLASRKVIEANGGVLDDIAASECHYWFAAPAE